MKDHVGNINDLITVEDMSSFDEKDFFFLTIEEAVEYQKEYQKKEQKKYPNKIVFLDPIFDKEIYDYFIENDGKVLTREEPWWSDENVVFPEWSVLFTDEAGEVSHCKVLPYSEAFKMRKYREEILFDIEDLRKFLNDCFRKNRIVVDNEDFPEEIKEYIRKPYDTEFPMHRVRFLKNGENEIVYSGFTDTNDKCYLTIEKACEYSKEHPEEAITVKSYDEEYVAEYIKNSGTNYVYRQSADD